MSAGEKAALAAEVAEMIAAKAGDEGIVVMDMALKLLFGLGYRITVGN